MAIAANIEQTEVQTAGALLPDGVLLELLRDSSRPEGVQVLNWKGRVLKIGPRIEHAGIGYAPVSLDAIGLSAMALPSSVAHEESPRELFTAVERLLSNTLGQPEASVNLMTLCVLASWIPEALPIAPLLWIVTSPTSPKHATLQLLGALCRRPLVLTGVRRGDLCSLPWHLHPTLVLDEPDTRPQLQQLLQSSSRREANIQDGKRTVNLYGSKIILSRELPREPSFASDSLRVILMPKYGRRGFLDQKPQQQIGEEFQNRLLGYRLRNIAKVRVPQFDVSHLTLPMQEIARAFGAVAVGDKELEEKVLALVTALEEEVRSERSNTTDAILIETLLFFSHKRDQREVRVMELAQKASAIRAGRGSGEEVSPETAGWRLKHLGIPTRRVGSAGNGVKFTDSIRRLVHQLGIVHDVRALPTALDRACPYCKEFGQDASSSATSSGGSPK